LWLLPDAAGIGVPVGSPDLANREQAMVAVGSEVVTRFHRGKEPYHSAPPRAN